MELEPAEQPNYKPGLVSVPIARNPGTQGWRSAFARIESMTLVKGPYLELRSWSDNYPFWAEILIRRIAG